MALTLTQDDLDAIVVAVLAGMNLTPPAVNVTLWKDETPSDLDGLGKIPAGSIHEIALSSFDAENSTVTASSLADVRTYLVGSVVALEFQEAPP